MLMVMVVAMEVTASVAHHLHMISTSLVSMALMVISLTAATHPIVTLMHHMLRSSIVIATPTTSSTSTTASTRLCIAHVIAVVKLVHLLMMMSFRTTTWVLPATSSWRHFIKLSSF